MKPIKVYDLKNYVESLNLTQGRELMVDIKVAVVVG